MQKVYLINAANIEGKAIEFEIYAYNRSEAGLIALARKDVRHINSIFCMGSAIRDIEPENTTGGNFHF